MKKIIFLASCCLFLIGCNKNEEDNVFVTKCSNSAKHMFETSSRLSATITHDKTNYITTKDNNLYMFSTLTKAIKAEEELNSDCAKYKNEYVDCKVERNDKSVSIVLNIKCNDTLDCSYNKLIQHYEEQGMTCEEEDTTE